MNRKCAECGAVLVQRDNEKPGRFAQCQYCGVKCSALVGSRKSAERVKDRTVDDYKIIERNGYLMRWCPGRKQPRGGTSSRGGCYVYVHRLEMEKLLGRELKSHEVVDHKDNNKHNNSIFNLKLQKNNSKHMKRHYKDGHLPTFGSVPRPWLQKPKKECLECGKKFKPLRARGEDTKCCSPRCAQIRRGRRTRMPSKVCPWCGSKFRPRRSISKNCSTACSNKVRYHGARY